MKKILDRLIDATNFALFKSCSILNNGDRIKFVFAGGASYNVPVEYTLQWFSIPHYSIKDGKVTEWDKNNDISYHNNLKAIKCRKVLKGHAIRIYLSNETAIDVHWDTVLMACEKSYEHFGGLTTESKKTVYSWHEKKGKEIYIS